MKAQIIPIPSGTKYLSDKVTVLPHNAIFDKGRVGAGGTFLALTSKCHTLIAVPFVDLIENKINQDEHKGKVFGMYAGVTYAELKAYLNDDSVPYKKIMTTYDSIEKVLPAIHTQDWNIMIDEYHLLFTQYSFRRTAAQAVLANYWKFNSFCFLTATVLEEEFVLEELKDVQIVKAEWEDVREVTVRSVKCQNDVLPTVAKVVQDHLNGVIDGNAYIFVNSVEFIKDLIHTCGLTNENCRVIYSKNNKTKLKIKRGTTLDAPKKINLLTSTVFEGADIYDENGRTYIVSDNRKPHTLLDISTSFQQIAGRIRNTKYWDSIEHIFTETRYSKDLTFKEFQEVCKKTEEEAFKLIAECNALSAVTREKIEVNCDTYVYKADNIFTFDPNLLKIDLYNFKITKCLYAVRVNVSNELVDNGFKVQHLDSNYKFEEKYEKEKKPPFDEIIKDIKNRSKDEEEYQMALARFPFLEEAINKIGFEGIEELNYHQSNIKRKLISILPVSDLTKVAKELKNNDKFANGNFIPSKYAKEHIEKLYLKYGIKKTANIKDFYEVKDITKRIDGKKTAGYMIIIPKVAIK